MTCQFCGQPATVHLTDIVQHKKRELHLCDGCARKHDLIPDGPAPQLNLPALVGLILGQPAPAPGAAALTCPACGLKYSVFRADGRLGCPADYDAFRVPLVPLLERIHRAARHAGKTPGGRRPGAGLRARLAAAVAAEDYEEAARLRDRLRREDASDESR